MFGLLNINKPIGITSRDVVNEIARLVRPDKVGHAGTLDPLASGVLVVCIGQATRLVEYIQRMPKRYTATFVLGQSSATDDLEGPITTLDGAPVPSHDQIVAAARKFVGEIEQVPPVYSAINVAGRRAYKLARKGQAVELSPRKVEIHELRIVNYEYPDLTLDIKCGSGTYIRALGRDLARALGTVAVMTSLVRTAIGDFRLAEAVEMKQLPPVGVERYLLPAARATCGLPKLELEAADLKRLEHGQRLLRDGFAIGTELAAVDASGNLRALLLASVAGELRPTRWFGVVA